MSRQLIKATATRLLGGRLRYSIPAHGNKNLYLSFDDGPHPKYTSAILDSLAEHAVTASFFLSGSAVEQYPELVLRIITEGHTVGNHGFLHQRPQAIGRSAFLTGIDRTQEALDKIAGKKLPRLFRPPYGTLTLTTLPGILSRGHRIIMWNHDSMDSFITEKSALFNAASNFTHMDSVIMLCHDDQPQTVQLLPQVIKFASANGYLVKHLPTNPVPGNKQ